MQTKAFLCALLCLNALTLSAQLRQPIEQFVTARQQAIVRELVELLSIPNVAADRANVRRNADRLRDMFATRGFTTEMLETDGNPLVFAERRASGAQRTLLFYAHYDGQPVDPKGWAQSSPFTPVLRRARLEDGGQEIPNFLALQHFPPEARLYARSASDDKAPIVALLTALDAVVSLKRQPTSNIKVILDGEEEARSPSLAATMGRYREKYRADLMLILDGPLHASGKPTLAFGARGNLIFQLTTFGPKFALHSGHYGNWAPNPAWDLTRLLASMKGSATLWRPMSAMTSQMVGLFESLKIGRRLLPLFASIIPTDDILPQRSKPSSHWHASLQCRIKPALI